MNPIMKVPYHRNQWPALLIFIPGEADVLEQMEKKKKKSINS